MILARRDRGCAKLLAVQKPASSEEAQSCSCRSPSWSSATGRRPSSVTRSGSSTGRWSCTYRAFGGAHAPARERARRPRRRAGRPRFVHHLQHPSPARGATTACIEAGAVLNPINIRLAPHEIAYILDHAESRVVVLPPRLPAAGRADRRRALAAADVRRPRRRGRRGRATTSTRRSSPPPRPSRATPTIDENAMAELFYTSGTTGLPKGVAMTHRELYLHALDAQIGLGFTEDDVVLHVVPLFHVNGWGDAALPDDDRRPARDAPQVRPGRADEARRAASRDPAARGARRSSTPCSTTASGRASTCRACAS